MKKYFAEAAGTFFLVFVGTGAIVYNDVNPGILGNFGIALSFGFAVCAMILLFGRISGAHINPAVTLAFLLNKQLHRNQIAPYLIAQVSGGIVASLLLNILFPNHVTLGATLPNLNIIGVFILEFLMSFLLMLLILFVSGRGYKTLYPAALSIGTCVALEAYFGGNFTGASMNPARSIAPALISGNTAYLWIYILAPISGMLFSVPVWKSLKRA